MCLFWDLMGCRPTNGNGPAFNVCVSAAAKGRNGPRDALLHYTSIQNRYEDHRLVYRQPRRMIDRSQAAEAFRSSARRMVAVDSTSSAGRQAPDAFSG